MGVYRRRGICHPAHVAATDVAWYDAWADADEESGVVVNMLEVGLYAVVAAATASASTSAVAAGAEPHWVSASEYIL